MKILTNFFVKTANFKAHYQTTAPEIHNQLPKVDAFTCSTGTGGTLSGIASYFKKHSPKTKIYLADPPGSVLYSLIKNKTLIRTGDGSITEGIGNGRLTENLKATVELIDDAIHVKDERSIDMVYQMLHEEGLFLGSSTALNLVAAVEAAKFVKPGI